MRRLVLMAVVVTACAHNEPKVADPAPASATTNSSDAATAIAPSAPQEDPAEIARKRAAAVATYTARASEREKLDNAYGSAILQWAIVRQNGGAVDDARVQRLWKRLKAPICFTEPKLNIVDRTKRKNPSELLHPIRAGANEKLVATRARCIGGKQPLVLSIRLDAIDEVETPGKERVVRLKPGIAVPSDRKPYPTELVEYDLETLERTVSAKGEVGIESRIFPFTANEASRDKGNEQMIVGDVRLKADPLEVRSLAELGAEVTQRILAVVQQALDRHIEGLRKAYTSMAINTAIADDGASQEHHALEAVALGGTLDADAKLAERLTERYGMPATELQAAILALHLD